MGPYLIGVLAAFLVQVLSLSRRTVETPIHFLYNQEELDLTARKWVRWAGYVIAGTITTTATYLTVGFWRHGWNLLQDVMYMTFARTGFAMAVAWVMYSFHKVCRVSSEHVFC